MSSAGAPVVRAKSSTKCDTLSHAGLEGYRLRLGGQRPGDASVCPSQSSRSVYPVPAISGLLRSRPWNPLLP